MKIMQKLHIWGIILITGIYSGSDLSCAPNIEKAKIGIDGTHQIVAIWQVSDSKTYQSYIQATVGKEFPSEIFRLTDPTFFYARNPRIATSTSAKALTKAVGVWIAKDLKTNHKIIQATILTSLGWNKTPTILSLNDGTENPSDDCEAIISDDGRIISIAWTAFLPKEQKNVLRGVISKNGGLTWTKPQNISSSEKVDSTDLSKELTIDEEQIITESDESGPNHIVQ